MEGVTLTQECQEIFLRFGIFESESPEFYDFCKSVYSNRFFFNKDHPFLKGIKDLYPDSVDTLYQGEEVYRARIIPPNLHCEKQDGFQVLNEKEIGAPPSCPEGRSNPAYTSRLYVSDTPYCALSEVRPACGETVAIGTGCVTKDLKVMSFVKIPILYSSGEISVNRPKSICEIANHIFSVPVLNNRDYLPMQIITEYVRLFLGVDGISYSSSQCPGGINYLFFDPSCIKFFAARPVLLKGIQYSAFIYSPKFSVLNSQKRNFEV